MASRELAPPLLRLEQVTSLAGLQSLEPAWASLYARCSRVTPFAAPEWLIPWWKHFGHNRLWTLAAWHERRLVGLAPLFIHLDEQGQRNVLLVGTGNSDYLDILAEPGFEVPMGRAVLNWLRQHRSEWDACHCQPLRKSSVFLESVKNDSSLPRPTPHAVCPSLTLSKPHEGLSAAIPAGQLKKFYYYQRRVSRTERVAVIRAEQQNLPELLGVLFELHRARWNERDQPGVLASDRVGRFHQEVAQRMLSANMLRLYALQRGGKWLAVLYGFSDRRRMYYYLGGFDPAFHRDSPGMLLIGHAIEQAIHDGLESFDFLSGQEIYKYAWGAQDQITYRWQTTSPPHAGSQSAACSSPSPPDTSGANQG